MAEVFKKSAELTRLKEILLVETADGHDKLWSEGQQLSFGGLADLVQDALQQLSRAEPQQKDRTAQEEEDIRLLRARQLRPARVNVENLHNSRPLASSYAEACRGLAETKADPESVYFWDREKKCRLLREQLEVVKNSWLKAGKRPLVESSDSEEEIRSVYVSWIH